MFSGRAVRLALYKPIIRNWSNMAASYVYEEKVAIAAVRRACALTSSVFETLIKNETLTKDDKSPVTVGDFAAQALISTILNHAFPEDPIVGEEDASDLRVESGRAMRDRIISLANAALTTPLTGEDDAAWGIGPGKDQSSEGILDAIDRGNHPGGNQGRMWTIDPIDGTKGFLRGEQYAVCLSLIVDAQVQVGVIGCPNLSIDPAQPDKGVGCIFSAVRGRGARQLTLAGTNPTSIHIPPTSVETLRFLESVEAAHSSHSFNDRVSDTLGVKAAPVRMDSQAKYAALCRGEGGTYLRMPTGVGYKEKIWDHAPGQILVEEAGGIVTNSRGEPLDFGLGRTLGENYGVIAAGKDIHSQVLAAVQSVQKEVKAKV